MRHAAWRPMCRADCSAFCSAPLRLCVKVCPFQTVSKENAVKNPVELINLYWTIAGIFPGVAEISRFEKAIQKENFDDVEKYLNKEM